MFEHLEFKQEGTIANVTLNRPQVHNAFNEGLIADLTLCFKEISQERSIRVVVLSGCGKSFCAGADLNWMKNAASYTEEENIADAMVFSNMLEAIDTCPVPVIGKIHGVALGGAMGLISCCDIVLAEENTRFGITEVRLGILPAVISPYVVRKIGISYARAFALTGELFDAKRAQEMGLVHEVLPEAQLNAALQIKIDSILAAGPQAISHCKSVLRMVSTVSFETARMAMPKELAKRRKSAEAQERMKDFLERRKV